MLKLTVHGNYKKVNNYFEKLLEVFHKGILDKYGQMGVDALSIATPKDTGLTASSWSYNIIRQHGNIEIQWTNSNVNKGVPIAVILQYGHGTGTGGWVRGIDYINPALQPVFEAIANDAWNEVAKL